MSYDPEGAIKVLEAGLAPDLPHTFAQADGMVSSVGRLSAGARSAVDACGLHDSAAYLRAGVDAPLAAAIPGVG